MGWYHTFFLANQTGSPAAASYVPARAQKPMGPPVYQWHMPGSCPLNTSNQTNCEKKIRGKTKQLEKTYVPIKTESAGTGRSVVGGANLTDTLFSNPKQWKALASWTQSMAQSSNCPPSAANTIFVRWLLGNQLVKGHQDVRGRMVTSRENSEDTRF